MDAQQKKPRKLKIDPVQYAINLNAPPAKKPRKKKIDHKLCVKCHEILPLTDFYRNKGYADAKFSDIYCRECARELCVNHESVRRYFWDNNRIWKDEIWPQAEKRALTALSTDKEFLGARTPKARRDEMLEFETAQKCLAIMNMVNNYQYIENRSEDANVGEFDPASPMGSLIEGVDELKEGMAVAYSTKWGGTYPKWEIDYLDDYYEQLEEDFILDNINLRDYAKKICKASLLVDKKYNEMLAGKCGVADWQKAQDIFDKLSKSAQFSESVRKNDNSTGIGSLCEILSNIEIHKQVYKPIVKFPEDDVDLILRDFRHTHVATQ